MSSSATEDRRNVIAAAAEGEPEEMTKQSSMTTPISSLPLIQQAPTEGASAAGHVSCGNSSSGAAQGEEEEGRDFPRLLPLPSQKSLLLRAKPSTDDATNTAATAASPPVSPTTSPSGRRRTSWGPAHFIEGGGGTNGGGPSSPGVLGRQGSSSSRRSILGRKLDTARELDGGITTADDELPEGFVRLRQQNLHRGGVYVNTCVGPIQIGIPPETIKDCLGSGMAVPRHYIVPLERFNRQLGSSVGINVAEFEFPAYYNFFFHRQSVNLIVDSKEVEEKIRIVFQETLFGPKEIDPEVDFAPDYPVEKRPNLPKELQYFRRFGDTLLTIDMLISFTHFNAHGVAFIEKETAKGKVSVKIVKSPLHGGEYYLSEIYDDTLAEGEVPPFPGLATLSGIVHLPARLLRHSISSSFRRSSSNSSSTTTTPTTPTTPLSASPSLSSSLSISTTTASTCNSPHFFVPPMFGVTVLGSSHGFDPKGSTSGYVLWVNRRGVMIDPPPHSSTVLEDNQIHPSVIDAVIVTHCHADHDAGTFQKILCEKRICLMTTPTIYASFIRKYSALSGIEADFLRSSHKFRPVKIGEGMKLRGATFNFFYSLHSIPCVGFAVEFGSKSIVFSADHMNDPERIQQMYEQEQVFSEGRRDELLAFPWHHDAILHEAGVPPIHTPMKTLAALPDDVKKRLHVVHVSASAIPEGSNLNAAKTGVKNTIELEVDVPEFSEAISVLNMIGDIYFFSGLSLSHARGLLEVGYKKGYNAGDLIVAKGDKVVDFCVLLMGYLEVTYLTPPDKGASSRRKSAAAIASTLSDEAAAILLATSTSATLASSTTPRATTPSTTGFALDLSTATALTSDNEDNKEEEEEEIKVQWSMGDWFGEEVLVSKEKRGGCIAQEEVRALTDVELIVFSGNELHYLLADAPKIAKRVEHLILPHYKLPSPRGNSPLSSPRGTGPTDTPPTSTLTSTATGSNRSLPTSTNKISSSTNAAASLPTNKIIRGAGGAGMVRLERLLTLNYTLNSLTRAQKLHLESLAEVATYRQGEYVWKQGDLASFVLIIQEGSLSFEGKHGHLMKSLGSLRRASQLGQGEDAHQSPCPPFFEKGHFIGSVSLVLHAAGHPVTSSTSTSNNSGGEGASSSSTPTSNGEGETSPTNSISNKNPTSSSDSNSNSSHSSSTTNSNKAGWGLQSSDLIVNTEEGATLLLFRAEALREFFSNSPGVLLCLLDAHFVL